MRNIKFTKKEAYFHGACYLRDITKNAEKESKLFREKVKKDLERILKKTGGVAER